MAAYLPSLMAPKASSASGLPPGIVEIAPAFCIACSSSSASTTSGLFTATDPSSANKFPPSCATMRFSTMFTPVLGPLAVVEVEPRLHDVVLVGLRRLREVGQRRPAALGDEVGELADLDVDQVRQP